jgi:hypothetical protein
MTMTREEAKLCDRLTSSSQDFVKACDDEQAAKLFFKYIDCWSHDVRPTICCFYYKAIEHCTSIERMLTGTGKEVK